MTGKLVFMQIYYLWFTNEVIYKSKKKLIFQKKKYFPEQHFLAVSVVN